VAASVTALTFAIPTWLSGVLVLPSMLKDSATRWGLASALGTALAALAATWGYGFATRTETEGHRPVSHDNSVQEADVRTIAANGLDHKKPPGPRRERVAITVTIVVAVVAAIAVAAVGLIVLATHCPAGPGQGLCGRLGSR
jgi:hypothetical protein